MYFYDLESDVVNETLGESAVKEHTAGKRNARMIIAEKFRGLERESITCQAEDKVCKNCGRGMKNLSDKGGLTPLSSCQSAFQICLFYN